MYYYDIYLECVFIKSVEDMEYATYYILKNKNAYYIIYSYSDNKESSISEGIIKIDNNRVIKVVNNKYVSTYSPYDHYLFKRSDLAELYLSFYDEQNNSQNNVINNKQSIINKPIKTIIKNLNENNIPQSQNEDIKIDDIKLENINIKDIETQLSELNDLNKYVTELKAKQEEEFLIKDCEERFEKKKERQEVERLKEKYNIFISDVNIYNKLINEKHFTESFIPPFFEAKYYIIKYLYKHNYFDNENINEPSQELFSLYKIIYEFVNNNFKINKDSEDFIDLLEEFEDFLPNDKNIKTDRQIMNNMNGKDQNNDMFVEPTGYENDTDSDTNSDSDNNNNDNDSDNDNISNSSINTEDDIKEIKNEINIYNKITKSDNIDPDFKSKYEAIKFMFHEGYFDNTDIYDSINDARELYYIICEYADKKTNSLDIRKTYKEFVEDFDNFDKLF